MNITRRTLFTSDLLVADHVCATGTGAEPVELDQATTNSLVLPLTGVFAKHEGPRAHFLATPAHAVLIADRSTYGITLPGGIGDECLVLRFSSQSLAQLAPEAMTRDGFNHSAVASQTLLDAKAVLARSLLWRRLNGGDTDALAVEEAGIGLLKTSLHAGRRRSRHARRDAAPRRRRQVDRVFEAITLEPQRKWTLTALADLACMSPWHLAHVFRDEAGSSVHQYVIRARLAQALDAVLDGDDDITTVALDAGFASHSHFTSSFRAQFGLTPTALRRDATLSSANDLRKIAIA
jgi:AraC family transcriptional regulator